MLAAQRRAQVLEAVRARGAVSVTDLSEALGVSAMTIRRDLDALAREGHLDKVHGGATTRRSASAEEVGFDLKARRERAEKDAIAALAAGLVHPGMAIGLSAGTTTWALARRLRTIPRLTVVTNSLRIADLLHGPPLPGEVDPAEVVLTGGVRTASDALVGPVAVSALEQLHCDLVFLGVHGMDARAGLTTPNLLEAQTDRALVASGRSAVVLADHTKWGTVGLTRILPLAEVDHLITDDGLAPEAVAALREVVAEVHLAPPPG
ncbi:DeoR/GlpR family DNA-binding transcription regulator [Ruania alba]|uniref:DNA-binding transcriptional regulator of sugar metabolism, DeoR/GlpR family n=1 Tax=Ruania alba TaxID=648782 RepID=A0A1H5FZ56_9MICO|nr:DeoR/GlpR family DNA-binding transcription regulator [Ruania alba]SEE08108.1 DNA-binding transcriptional regulator of sugar metabolism, DeoR/GlpR family [Ruania alba]